MLEKVIQQWCQNYAKMEPKWEPKFHEKRKMEWKRHAKKWCRNWLLQKVARKAQREGKGSDEPKKWGPAKFGPRRKESGEVYLPLKGGTPSMTPARRVCESARPPGDVICFDVFLLYRFWIDFWWHFDPQSSENGAQNGPKWRLKSIKNQHQNLYQKNVIFYRKLIIIWKAATTKNIIKPMLF